MILSYQIIDHRYTNIRQILKEEFHLSDRFILKLKTNQQIFLDNQPVSIGFPIETNQLLTVNLDLEESSSVVSTKMDLAILYEDDSMLIINKPPYLAVHPSQLHYDTSLSNGVKYYFDSIGLKRKIRPVNRLDKDTSRHCDFCKKCLYPRMFDSSNAATSISKTVSCYIRGKTRKSSRNH